MLKKLARLILSSLLFVACFSSTVAVATEQPTSTDQLNFAVGQQRRIFLGVATLEVRILQIGTDGWLLVEFTEDAPTWYIDVGDRYWINTSQIWMISE